MNAGFLTLALLFSTAIISLKGYTAQPALDLQSIKSIKHQYSCFSAEFSSYDSWLEFVRSRKETQFKRQGVENMAEEMKNFETYFTTTFQRASFDSAKENLDCRFLTYVVDGQEIHGVLVVPKSSLKQDGKIPVIIYNRGGTRNLGSLVFGHVAYELFPIAQQGFAIIASNYRKDEQYGADNIDEVTALFGIIESIPALKSDKVGVYGVSRGGLTTWQLAKALPQRIAAIATVNGVTDSRLWAGNRAGIQNNISLVDGYKDNPDQVFNRLSPVKWVEQISTAPILLMHSRDDKTVNVMHSMKFSEQLINNNRFFSMRIFEDGDHELVGRKDEAREELIQWFSRYIK
ncbi:alpha/beta hydrolase family protein [Rheinheimera sp. NSM]|uniref:alpha/beta hydrolase family protein n=1 Tax=Rheinheimera sp. NSM TaxID=3457884 RepID=UPI0040357396